MKFGLGVLYVFRPVRFLIANEPCSHKCTVGLLHVVLRLPQIMSEIYLREFHWLSLSKFLGKLNKLHRTPLSVLIILCINSRFTQLPTLLLWTDMNCHFLGVPDRKEWLLCSRVQQKAGKIQSGFLNTFWKYCSVKGTFIWKSYNVKRVANLIVLTDNVAAWNYSRWVLV